MAIKFNSGIKDKKLTTDGGSGGWGNGGGGGNTVYGSTPTINRGRPNIAGLPNGSGNVLLDLLLNTVPPQNDPRPTDPPPISNHVPPNQRIMIDNTSTRPDETGVGLTGRTPNYNPNANGNDDVRTSEPVYGDTANTDARTSTEVDMAQNTTPPSWWNTAEWGDYADFQPTPGFNPNGGVNTSTDTSGGGTNNGLLDVLLGGLGAFFGGGGAQPGSASAAANATGVGGNATSGDVSGVNTNTIQDLVGNIGSNVTLSDLLGDVGSNSQVGNVGSDVNSTNTNTTGASTATVGNVGGGQGGAGGSVGDFNLSDMINQSFSNLLGGVDFGGAIGDVGGGSVGNVGGGSVGNTTTGPSTSSIGDFNFGGMLEGLFGDGALGDTIIDFGASEYASDKTLEGINKQIDYQRSIYDQNVERLQPYNQLGLDNIGGLNTAANSTPGTVDPMAGQRDLGAVTSNYGLDTSGLPALNAGNRQVNAPNANRTNVNQFNPFDINDPQLDYLIKAGAKGINNAASSSGKLYSGETLEALQDMGQNAALGRAGQIQNITSARDSMNLGADQQYYGQQLGQNQFTNSLNQQDLNNASGIRGQLFNEDVTGTQFDINQFNQNLQNLIGSNQFDFGRALDVNNENRTQDLFGYNKLFPLVSGVGQPSASGQSGAGQNFGNTVNSSRTNKSDANAGQNYNRAGTWGNFLGGLFG